MSDYTPTTRGVTAYYCLARQEGTGVTVEEGAHERFHAEFDRWLEEVQREAAEKAWNQAVGRALEITQTEYLIGDGLLTVIGNPYAAEAYRGEKNE